MFQNEDIVISYILSKTSKCFCDSQKKAMNFPPFQAQLHILYVED